MLTYSVVVDVDDILSNLELTFPTEEAANEWADIMSELIVEFTMIAESFFPPF